MTKLLTFEISMQDEMLEVHMNKEGITYLIEILNKLSSQDSSEHVHLRSISWAGSELTEHKQNPNTDIVNHVKIFLWE